MSNVPAVRTPVPAGAPAQRMTFAQMLARAEVLARTELVAKPLQGRPEAIMAVGVWGDEHGVPLMTALSEVHIIEGRPSPSAQLRLALIRRAGHEIGFTETSRDRAVLRARRKERRGDPDGWVTVTYTIDDAREAELLDTWVERWLKTPGAKYEKKHTWKIGDDRGDADLTGAPDWVHEEIAGGRVHSKDNWRKYRADMLRARAAAVMSRMEFSDVMLALDAHEYTAEELGLDVGHDLDEPAETPERTAGDTTQHPSIEDGDAEEVDDAIVVEDLDPGPEPDAPRPAGGPAPDEDPEPGTPMPAARPGERAELAALKQRIAAGMTTKGWAGLIPWLEACKIDPTLDRLSAPRIDAVHAELDRRGVAPHQPPSDGDLGR